MRTGTNSGRHSGFSLIELMVAMALGLMVILAIGAMFVTSSRSYNQDDRQARLQENGRFAVYALSRDISMAAFWGGLTTNPAGVASLGTTCGLTLDLNNPVQITNSAPDAATVSSAHGCIDTTKIVLGTDIIATKRVFGGTETSYTSNAAYLRTDGSNGTLIQYAGTAPGAGQSDWRYLPRIYYVRNKLVDGVNVPTLYRKVLDTSLNMVDEELVEGIENVQVQFGIDTDAPADGKVNFYTVSPTSSQLAKAITARVNVLARAISVDPDPAYRNNKTFDLGEGATTAANDRYRRQLFTTTISLRNVNNLSRI